MLLWFQFELLCCVQDEKDPAVDLVNRLCENYPKVDVKIFKGICWNWHHLMLSKDNSSIFHAGLKKHIAIAFKYMINVFTKNVTYFRIHVVYSDSAGTFS